MATIKIPQGSTLGGLARQYNTSVSELLRLNPNIKDPNRIFAGANLVVPDKTTASVSLGISPDIGGFGGANTPQFATPGFGSTAPTTQAQQPATATITLPSRPTKPTTPTRPKIFTTPSGATVDEQGNLVSPPTTQISPQASVFGETGLSSQLDGVYRELYDIMKNFLSELQKRGQVINPNVPITPERVTEFMAQAQSDLSQFVPFAEKEITPYYEGQLKLAREDFLRSLGYTSQEVLLKEQELERKFIKAGRQIGEEAAERGFALSGARQQQEQELIGEAQRELAAGRRELGFKAGTAAREFAQRFGTAQLPTTPIPTTPKVTGLGAFEKPIATQPIYEISPETFAGLTGEKEFEKRAAIQSRAAELEQAFRSQQAIEQQRKLTL